jgi:membrane-associated progesterone receptor component
VEQKLIGLSEVFSGHDASRALAKTSTKAADVSPEWYDLPDAEKKVLNDWYTFFSKRYNIIGVVAGAKNLDPDPSAASHTPDAASS